MDEYAFTKKITMEACRPQAEMTGHYMLALSTPNVSDDHWSVAEQQKAKEGTGNVIDYSVSGICDACDLKPDILKIKCDHVRPKGGIDKNRQAKRKSGYDMDIATVMREKLGITTTNMTPYYNKEDLDYFAKNIWKRTDKHQGYVVGVDPSNGGPCMTAFVGGMIQLLIM